MNYTMRERVAVQNKTFELKKQGFKATRILRKMPVGFDKNKQPIYEQELVSFGYSKDRAIPKEIFEKDLEKYTFEFIYLN